jgi:hypothetical protein
VRHVRHHQSHYPSTTAPQGEDINNHGDLDQRARAMLPKHQRGIPVWDLINNQ